MTIASPIPFLLVAGVLLALVLHSRRRRQRESGAAAPRPPLAEVVLGGLIVLAAGDLRIEMDVSADALVVAVDASASARDRSGEVERALESRLPSAVRRVSNLPGTHESDLGALLSAAAAELPARGGRVLLVSDGIDVGDELALVAAELGLRGVVVDVLPVGAPGPWPRIADASAPASVAPGAPVRITATLAGGAVSGRVVARSGARTVASPEVEIPPGDEGVEVELWIEPGLDPGVHELSLELELTDPVAAGATRGPLEVSMLVAATERAPVLLVGEARLPDGWPAQWATRRLAAGDAREELAGAGVAVVAGEVEPALARELAHAVQRQGVGLVLQGGEHGFGAGGWHRSELGELSPLDPLPEDPRQASVVLLADRSGSMTAPRVQETRQAVARLARELAPGDRLLVLAYADGLLSTRTGFLEVQGAGESPRAAAVEAALRGYPEGAGRGSTRLAGALQAAIASLEAESAPVRLLLIVTDAELHAAGGEDARAVRRALAALPEDIEARVLVTSERPGAFDRELLVEDGAGDLRVEHTGSGGDAMGGLLAGAFSEATSARWFEDGPLPIVDAASGRRTGMTGRVNRTRARDEAPLDLMAGELPLLATWRRGRGRVAAIATRPGGNAGDPWYCPVYAAASSWVSLLDEVGVPGDASGVKVRARWRHDGNVEVHASIEEGSDPVQLTRPPELELVCATGSARQPMRLAGPGAWKAVMPPPSPVGSVVVRVQCQERTARTVLHRPVGRELRRVLPDLAALGRVCGATGGSLWAPGELDRAAAGAQVPRGRAERSLSPWLLIAAACMIASGLVRWPPVTIGRIARA